MLDLQYINKIKLKSIHVKVELSYVVELSAKPNKLLISRV